MTFNFKVTLKESNAQINKKILDGLRPQVNKYFRTVFSSVKQPIVEIVTKAIRSAPEYSAIQSGTLKYEFGLPDSAERLDKILKFWEKIYAEYQPVTIKGSQLKGGISLKMIQSDFADILSLRAATLVTEKKQELNWLEWLLLFGNQTIIKDYVVEFGNNPRSRTGKAVMRGVTSGKWSVPSEYAGTINNNWITRSIDSVESQIDEILIKALKENL